MKKTIILFVTAFLIANISYGQILKNIESFSCGSFPLDEIHIALDLTKETYDYRLEDNAKVPPTLTDVFICDIWLLITKWELKIDIQPSEIDKKKVLLAFDIYKSRNWSEIPGLRPWTHWNFIRSLSKRKRKKLAKEVVSYIKEKGINEGETN